MSYQEIITGNGTSHMSRHRLGRSAGPVRSTMKRPQIAALASPGRWQARAIAVHRRKAPAIIPDVQAAMAAQLLTLTGRAIPAEAIVVDPVTRMATTVVDGAIFRLVGRDLSLLRPCSYCGTGQFASLPIRSVADLGYALADWEPLHDDCQPEDPRE